MAGNGRRARCVQLFRSKRLPPFLAVGGVVRVVSPFRCFTKFGTPVLHCACARVSLPGHRPRRKPCSSRELYRVKSRCGEMADAWDLKSLGVYAPCGFESRHRHSGETKSRPGSCSVGSMSREGSRSSQPPFPPALIERTLHIHCGRSSRNEYAYSIRKRAASPPRIFQATGSSSGRGGPGRCRSLRRWRGARRGRAWRRAGWCRCR